MYSYLKGNITEKNLDHLSFVLEVSGLGYLLNTNLKFINRFPLEQESKIYVSALIKEDSHKLYAFPDRVLRDLFEILVSVSGVGPKAALSILNLLDIDQLINAVLQNKPKLISSAPGIGPKTAQRIILELENKITKFNKKHMGASESGSTQNSIFMCFDQVHGVLTNLGYSEVHIDRVISKAQTEQIADNPEYLVKFCLKELSQEAFS